MEVYLYFRREFRIEGLLVFEGSLGLCEESVKPLWNNGTWKEHAIEPYLTKTSIFYSH
jgi:hypothetical protein